MLNKDENKSTGTPFDSGENEGNKKEKEGRFNKLLTKSVAFVGTLGTLAGIADYAEFIDIPFPVLQLVLLYIVVILIWQGIDVIGYDRLMRGMRRAVAAVKKLFRKYWKAAAAGAAGLIFFGVIFCFFYHTDRCYREVAEIYGLPQGVGNVLSGEEKGQLAGYWRIKDYPVRHQMTLDYVEPYGQLNLMQEYSSLYQMTFFQPSAKIVYRYTKEGKIRHPEQITYYNSSGKMILQLDKKEGESYEVVRCAEEDKPQLLNSTLFRVPDGQAGRKLTAVQLEASYDESGRLQTRRLGSEAYNQYGVNGESYEYDQEGRLVGLRYLDIYGQPICNSIGIMAVAFEYGGDGRLDSIQYFSDEKMTEKTEGFWGVACERFSYYQEGNIKERRQESRDGNWWYDTNNVYMYHYAYENGKLIQEKYLGQGQVPTREKEFQSSSMDFSMEKSGGKKVLTITLDSVDNSEEMDGKESISAGQHSQKTDFQEQDSPSDDSAEKTEEVNMAEENSDEQTFTEKGMGRVRNYTAIQYVLNRKNHVLEKGYYSAEGEPVANEAGYYAQQFRYDSYLRVIEEAYYGIDKKPCFVKGGYVKIRNTYGPESEDEIILKEYLDDNDNLVMNRECGYASVRYDYPESEEGKVVCRSFYSADGRPACMKDYGCERIQETYDDRGLLTEEAYQDENGNPTERTDYGIAKIRYNYGDDGNVIRQWYLGVDGEIANRLDVGYAAIHREFKDGQLIKKYYKGYENQGWKDVPSRETGAVSVVYTYLHGRIQKEEYFDAAGEPVLRSDTGYASVEYQYDNAGMVCERRYYGTAGKLIRRKDTGYAVIELAYDDHGRCKSERYYGTEGHDPVISSKYHCAGFDYEYDEQGNRNKICSLDLDGELMIRSDYGYAVIDKIYDNQGNVIEEKYFDDEGNPAINKEGGYASYQSEYEKGLWKESRYYDTQDNLTLRSDTGYALIRLEYDEYGQRSAVRYLDTDEKPVISTEYHCACMRYQYDERGNQTDITYFDRDDTPLIRSDLGYAHVHKAYDGKDRIREEFYYDTEEQPVVCKDKGYASYTNEYDGGKWVLSRYYDEAGDMILRSDTGYAMITLAYNSYGDCMEERYYGTGEEPVISTKYHCASRIWNRDAMGNTEDLYYKGLENELIVRSDLGYAHLHQEYDEQGKVVKESYFGVNEEPVNCKESGYASSQDSYENGRWVEGRYYDEDGNLVLRKDRGYAVIKLEYDADGNVTAEYYFDTENQPVISSRYECASRQYEYNEKAEMTHVRYVGLDGELTVCPDYGYAELYKEYDAFGNITKESYFDAEGAPAATKEGGYTSFISIYKNGKWIESRFFDKNEKPVRRKDKGYALIRLEYDAYGQAVGEYYYGTEEQPVIGINEYCAGRNFEYDENGRTIKVRYLGLDEESINLSDKKYAEIRYEYNDFGDVIKISYFDVQGNLLMLPDEGYAFLTNQYVQGKRVETKYYDKDGQPVLRKDHGYASETLAYDAYGKCTEKSFYGTDGEPVADTETACAGLRYEYDERGNQTDTWYYGTDGELAPCLRKGYAQIHSEYDALDQEVKISYFDPSGEPVMCEDGGFASCTHTYTNNHRTESRYYDTQEKLVLRADEGYAVRKVQYDEYGQRKTEKYFDAELQSVMNTKYFCFGWNYDYDDRGNDTYYWYCDTDGNRILREDIGAALYYRVLDSCDHLVWEGYYDKDLQLIVRKDSDYAAISYTYDQDRMTQMAYMDADSNPVYHEQAGYAIIEYEYYDTGEMAAKSTYDADGNLIKTDEGYARIEYEYDSTGNMVDWSYFNENGEEIEL